MELGKHLDKSLWGLADKALPVIYGIGFIYLVIRVLPEEEFGNFVLTQEIFLIISGLAMAFALQPLLKFASEVRKGYNGIITVCIFFHLLFVVASMIIVLAVRMPLSELLNAPGLASLLAYIPAMLVASFIRNTALVLLQSRFSLQRVFWVDAVHFLGAPFLVWVMSRMHIFDSALDLILINIVSLSASSLAGLALSKDLFRMTWRLQRSEWKEVWDYGLYSLGGIVSYLTYTRADTFILSASSGPMQVAVYNSAKIFTRIFDMATQVVQMIVLPAVSLLSSRGEKSSLKILVEKAILFATVGMIPVFLLLLLIPEPVVDLVYSGRYPEAASILRLFALLSLPVPLLAIGSSVLMGLGEARASFILGAQTLVVSLAAFFLLVPSFGPSGAALGSVITSYIMGWVTVAIVRRRVPLTVREVLSRSRDITAFLRSRFARLRGHA
jgi:O-antigen/teichoic acid export membrane protein